MELYGIIITSILLGITLLILKSTWTKIDDLEKDQEALALFKPSTVNSIASDLALEQETSRFWREKWFTLHEEIAKAKVPHSCYICEKSRQ